MNIFGFKIRLERRRKLSMREQVTEYLKTPDMRALAAQLARSEVKNYMAYLAEEAEVPYEGPVKFVRSLSVPTDISDNSNDS